MFKLINSLKFLIFSLLLLSLNSSAYAVEATTKYAIYIDAGSSSSRLYLYQYKNTNSLPEINEIFSKKISPGLSSFQDNPENASSSINERFIGEYNFKNCSHLYIQLIENNNVKQAIHYPKQMHFVAYSGFYGPLHFFAVDTKASEKNINQSIQTTCYKPWELLEKTYAQISDRKYLAHYCAEATYISDLLFKGYQLSSDQLLITKEMNGHKIAWPLGALFYHLVK